MRALVPCTACHRHVSSREAACPFCGGALAQPESPRVLPTTRLGRAATFAFGATLAGVAGCSTSHVTPDAPATSDDAPATSDVPEGTDAGSTDDAGTAVDAGSAIDAGGVAPPYGLPPDDAGGGVPLYGGPPEP